MAPVAEKIKPKQTQKRKQATAQSKAHPSSAAQRNARTKTARQKNMHNISLGRRGEDAAVSFLEKRGFSIIERNWTCFAGEADVIALDDEALHFIEVKTRMGTGNGFGSQAVTTKKRKRYEQIAEIYLGTYNGCETGITFDIIEINVLPNERAMLRFFKNVLSCDCGR